MFRIASIVQVNQTHSYLILTFTFWKNSFSFADFLSLHFHSDPCPASLLFFRFGYLTALIYDISNNLDCVTVNRSMNESYRFVNCTFLPTPLAGNGDNWYLWVIYCAAVFCLSFFESVMETVLPVLAGDQVNRLL